MIKRMAVLVLAAAIIDAPASFMFATDKSHTPDSRVVPQLLFTAIDTMKESMDTVLRPLTDAQIADDVNLAASLQPNYITVDTYWDYPDYMQQWVDAIRAAGKHVWFRIHPNQWEDSNGTTGVMTPAAYEAAEQQFITTHPSFFRPGDILDPCPEPENGLYWKATYGSSWTANAPNAATNAFNQFVLDTTTTANTALHNAGIYGVVTTVRSLSAFYVKRPTVLYPSTVAALGQVTVDAYPDAKATDPTTAATDWMTEIASIEAARPNVPIIIGEMGYSNDINVSDAQQAAVLEAEFESLATLFPLRGVNYWVGAGDSTAGGYTHIFNGSAGAWTPRPAAANVSSFYLTYGVVCPSGWTCADIGNAVLSGSQSIDNGTWTIEDSGGGDIWGTADQFYFDWQTLAGDGSVSAQVTTQTNIDPWAKAGVMLRGSTDPGAPFYAALVTPANGFFVEYRTAQNAWFAKSNAVTGTVPRYLKISRSGSTFNAYSSGDDSTWTLIPGSTTVLSLPTTLLAGLAVTPHSSGVLSAVTVDNVVLASTQAVATPTLTPAVATPTPTPAAATPKVRRRPGMCPSSWSCVDVGNPTRVGNQSLAGGVWTMQGSGDIWGSADQFHFDWRKLRGNGRVSAQVLTQTNIDPWAKAGVMLRGSTDPGAPFYAALVTPANGFFVEYRTARNAWFSMSNSVRGRVPRYLKVTRSGNTFSAYSSSNGSTWTLIPGSTTTLKLPTALLGGLVVTSHVGTVLGTVKINHVVL